MNPAITKIVGTTLLIVLSLLIAALIYVDMRLVLAATLSIVISVIFTFVYVIRSEKILTAQKQLEIEAIQKQRNQIF